MINEKNIKLEVGKRIKLLRNELGLTQEQLANKLPNVRGKSSIANYENGSNLPSDEVKLKLCEIFDCSLDYLMCKSDIRNFDDLKKQDLNKLRVQLKQKNVSETQIDTLINYMSKEPFNITYDFEDFLDSLKPDIKEFIINFKFNSNLKMLQLALREQEFRFAYHKETEGLTDEEITDALRFYKEMKKKVKGDK